VHALARGQKQPGSHSSRSTQPCNSMLYSPVQFHALYSLPSEVAERSLAHRSHKDCGRPGCSGAAQYHPPDNLPSEVVKRSLAHRASLTQGLWTNRQEWRSSHCASLTQGLSTTRPQWRSSQQDPQWRWLILLAGAGGVGVGVQAQLRLQHTCAARGPAPPCL